jgi:hypothetical protein
MLFALKFVIQFGALKACLETLMVNNKCLIGLLEYSVFTYLSNSVNTLS